MKKHLLLILAACCSLCAMSETKRLSKIVEVDEDEIETYRFTYNSDGSLHRVIDGYDIFTLDYSGIAGNTMKLIYDNTAYGKAAVWEISLENGNALKSIEKSNGFTQETTGFTYADGFLSSVRSVDDDGDVTESKITWTDGNIAKVVFIDSDDPEENYTCTFKYSDTPNLGRISLFDTFFSIDIDELEYVAMAGHMGRTPANLPSEITFEGPGFDNMSYPPTVKLEWEFDADGYPVKLAHMLYDILVRDSYMTFTWEDSPSAIESIVSPAGGKSEFYTIDGLRVAEEPRGFFIERRSDGSAIKRFNR